MYILTFKLADDCFVGERRKLDIEYFSKLLEKILEYQKSKKKLRSVAEKKSSQKGKRKTKGKICQHDFFSRVIIVGCI